MQHPHKSHKFEFWLTVRLVSLVYYTVQTCYHIVVWYATWITLTVCVHPHWVQGCSQIHNIFFVLFSLVLGLNTLPGALAFCMAYAWLGELTRHTFLSHSLGLLRVFCLVLLTHPRSTCSLCLCLHFMYCYLFVFVFFFVLCLHLFWPPTNPPLPFLSLPFFSCPLLIKMF